MEKEQKLALYRELVTCGGDLAVWEYDKELKVVSSNSSDAYLFDKIFEYSGLGDVIKDYRKTGQAPLMLSLQIGLIWYAVFENDYEKAEHFHLLGPVFSADISAAGIEDAINQTYTADYSLAYKHELVTILTNLPVISPTILTRYALMLHYILNGEKLGPSDIVTRTGTGFQLTADTQSPPDRRRLAMAEDMLIRMVREGDLNYKSALDRAASVSTGLAYRLKDPLRDAKNAALVFTSLCTRAAVEGGLPPELAHSLSNSYLQSIENCRTVSDVASMNTIMYDDFVRRVHRSRRRAGLSRAIRECCEYIEFHVEEKIGIATLASHLGYTEYYLSRRFKQEMDCSINGYIKKCKIARAQILLKTTDDSIQAIADRLSFCSRSFFADTFRHISGLTPAVYRDRGSQL